MFQRPFAVSAALVAIVLAGCGQSAIPGQLASTRTAAPSVSAKAAASKAEFVAAVKAKGIKLTEAELAIIQTERTLVPNGKFAPRPAENLSAEQNLEVHWKKHGHEFRPAIQSPEDYLKQGNAAATGERGEVRFFFDTTSFKKGYQSHVIRWVPKTMDFTAFRADGSQTTYYQSKPKENRFIEVPVW